MEPTLAVLFDVFDAESDGSVTIHNFLFVLARISSVSASTLRSSIEAKVKPLRETQQDKESNKWPGLAFDEFYQVRLDQATPPSCGPSSSLNCSCR